MSADFMQRHRHWFESPTFMYNSIAIIVALLSIFLQKIVSSSRLTHIYIYVYIYMYIQIYIYICIICYCAEVYICYYLLSNILFYSLYHYNNEKPIAMSFYRELLLWLGENQGNQMGNPIPFQLLNVNSWCLGESFLSHWMKVRIVS